MTLRDGGATPNRPNQTPMHVSMTPRYTPNTPIHDTYASGGFTPSRTPLPYIDPWGASDTPATEPVRTPGTAYSDPNTIDYPGTLYTTPATPGTPGTPGTSMYTTPYDSYNIRTPGTPGTPGTSMYIFIFLSIGSH